MCALNVERVPVQALKPYERNARTHSKKQVKQIAASISRFGFTNPVLIDANRRIIAGHGRVEAAKLLGMAAVPTLKIEHLSEAEKRAYILADNKLAENAGWDRDILAIELQGLADLEFDLELTGFETAEIDLILDEQAEKAGHTGPEDQAPEPEQVPVSRPGDLWLLGQHKLLCGNAREAEAYAALMGGERAQMVFTDPPYNVPIDGHVSGLGRVKHREFAMASGEMSEGEFIAFLETVLGHVADASADGSIHFVCMDWRHAFELMTAGRKVYDELKNVCVWNKDNGGMGTFYRSKHELVFAFKKGEAPHINTFELGQHGRYRTNVWDYAGVNTLRPGRLDELALHPTVKPVALVADAIKDCSKRNGLVLDPFAGSGTTMIAADKTGRRARMMEIDPIYVDVCVRRWQALTGKRAVLAGAARTFEEVEEERRPANSNVIAEAAA